MSKFATMLVWVALSVALVNAARAPMASAAPRAQSTAAALTPTLTDEPPKSPYVFPTPIFIPTYPGDTSVATIVPRSASQPTGQNTYTVQSGDSLWVIAQKVYGNGAKYPIIMSANGLTDSTRLRVGMVLKIPPIAGAQPLSPAGTPAAATPAPLTQEPTAEPSAAPTVGATPTPAPAAASFVPTTLGGAIVLAINLLTGILLVGAGLAAVLAVLVYARARRMEGLSGRRKRIQIRQ